MEGDGKTFFDELKIPEYYPPSDHDNIKKWEDAYNIANYLENSSKNTTFLFSAQHKDCIILATILTALYNSHTIIWRTDVVKDIKIDDDTNENEHHKNAVNMSASLSLLDFEMNESANSYLFNGSISNVNKGTCDKLLQTFGGYSKIIKIINKYREKLENRYLCVFEFDDEQLDRYVRLSGSFGGNHEYTDVTDMKKKIITIKQKYLNDQNSRNNIQCRILTTQPNSINPYISHILEPNNKIYSDMKNELIGAIYELKAEEEKKRLKAEQLNADEEKKAKEEEEKKAKEEEKTTKKTQITADEDLKTERLKNTWRIFKPFKGFRGRWFGDTRRRLFGVRRSSTITGGRVNKTRRRKFKKHTQKNKRRKNSRK